jgi:hypothetical protein
MMQRLSPGEKLASVTGTTYQTVRLRPGKHRSPDDGACVMELSSMLAGEPFSDRPVCACRVIGAVLRGYNDTVEDGARQDLLRFAADVVGTRSTDMIEQKRLDRCFEVFDELELERRRTLRRRLTPVTAWEIRGLRGRAHLPRYLDDFGRSLARYFHRAGAGGHERFLALVDELIAMSDRPPTRTTPATGTTLVHVPQ